MYSDADIAAAIMLISGAVLAIMAFLVGSDINVKIGMEGPLDVIMASAGFALIAAAALTHFLN